MEPVSRLCPGCAVPLVRENYESSWVFRCPACRGTLLSTSRLERIERDPGRNPALLKTEARAEHWTDTGPAIPCPRCRATMAKRPLTRGAATFYMDYCQACDLVWLDGGELALAQLVYETSSAGREARALQQRALEAQLSPERMARFEQALARLPDDAPSEGPAEAVDWMDLLWLLRRR